MNRLQRFVSLLLVITLTVSLLPTDAAAAEQPFTLSAADLQKMERLVGSETDAWHEGTPYSRTMSAYQTLDWLNEFDLQKLGGIIRRIQSLLDTVDPSETALISRLKELKKKADDICREVRLFSFSLDEQLSVISANRNLAEFPDTEETRKTRLWRQVQKAALNLEELMPKIEAVAPGYENACNAISDELRTISADSKDNLPLLSPYDTAALIGGATPFANLRSAGFYIDVLNAREAGFYVTDEEGNSLKNAEITVICGDETVTGFTNDRGIMKYDTENFKKDSSNEFLAAVKVEADGFRVWETCGMYYKAGSSQKIVLAVDDGSAYLQRVDFRGMDVLHDQDVLYCTSENDATQTLTAYVHTYPGQTGKVVLSYTDLHNTALERSVEYQNPGAESVQKVELSDKWAQILSPYKPFVLSLENNDNGDGASQTTGNGITVEKAVVPKPRVTPASSITSPGFDAKFSFPFNLKFLKNLDVSLSIPKTLKDRFPINFSFDVSGKVSIGIGISFERSGDDKDEDWKVVNSRTAQKSMDQTLQVYHKFCEILEKEEDAKKIAKGEMAELFNMHKFKMIFNLMLLFQGEFKLNPATKVYDCKASALFQASIDGSFSMQALIVPSPPIFFCWTISVGLVGGAKFAMTFNADPREVPEKTSNWRNFQFDRTNSAFFFGGRFSTAASLGIGIRGLASAQLQGGIGFQIGLNWKPWADDEKLTHYVIYSANVSVLVDILFLLHFKATIIDEKKQYPEEEKSSVDGMNATGGDIEAVIPRVEQLPIDSQSQNGMRTVCVYANLKESLYLGFRLLDGRMQVLSMFHNRKGYWNVTELKTDGLFGKKAFSNAAPRDSYIYDYAVTALADTVHPGSITQNYIALTLLMAVHGEDVPDPEQPGAMIPGKTYGETLYFSHDAVENAEKVLTIAGGNRLTPRTGCFTLPNVTFSFMDKSNVLLTLKETYYVVSSMTNRAQPQLVETGVDLLELSQKVDLADQKPYGEVTVTTSHATDNKFDFGSRPQPRDYRVNVYLGESSFLGNDIAIQCIALFDNGEIQALEGITDYYYSFAGKWVYRSQGVMQMMPGRITGFVYLGTESGISTAKGGQQRVLLFTDPNDAGDCRVQMLRWSEHGAIRMTDLGVRVPSATYYAVNISERVIGLYYLCSNAPTTDPETMRYAYKAIYLARDLSGGYFASKAFTLAIFDRKDLNPTKGVNSIDIMRDPSGFLHGAFTAEKTAGSGEGSVTSYFGFKQTPQVRLDCALTENPLVKAGDTINILLTVSNTGNIPVSAFRLDMTAEDVTSGEKHILSSVKVDCANRERSQLECFDLEGNMTVSESGDLAVSRFETNEEQKQSMWLMGNGSAVESSVLMPEESVNYRVPFAVPQKFAGHQYNVTLQVGAISTLALQEADGRYSAAAAWIHTLRHVPNGLDAADSLPVVSSADEEPVTVTMLLQNDTEADLLGLVPVSLIGGEIPMPGDSVAPDRLLDTDEAFSAFGTKVIPSEKTVSMDVVDLTLNADPYEKDGETFVFVSATNRSSAEASGLRLIVEVDGKEACVQPFPADFRLTCNECLSMDIPLSTLLEGLKDVNPDYVEYVSLKLVCDQTEYVTMNNEDTVYLNRAFFIVRDPEDRTVIPGAEASFEVLARGGTMPYTYQWQQSTNGRNGAYRNIPGATDRVLTVTGVHERKKGSGSVLMDTLDELFLSNAKADQLSGQTGTFYRCVVTEAGGKRLTSDPALLLVIPRTGDETPVTLWFVLTGVTLLGAVLLTLRRRKDRY